ncbi:tryptophan synthase subunit alpha [Streptomyces sp. MS1.AVA.3]|uniref:tryptophan synthase subunit alpha n=1 Tax=Streptomyces decoyicus TaxID=249567 RepID=UPI0030C36FCD
MTDLTAADRLTSSLSQPRPALGVFLPAGFPSRGADAEALQAFARSGATILEVGIPYSDPALDGPPIAAAYRQALQQGSRIRDVFETVQQVATTTQVAIVVVSYWGPVSRLGVEKFTRHLAQAGAAGAMIPDLPIEEAEAWLAAAREAGLLTPQFVSRHASDERLARVCSAASGWIYAPAADAPTGYEGTLDLSGLQRLTDRLGELTDLPVVTGIGLSTPDYAAAASRLVRGVVIGSAVVRPLLEQPDRQGIEYAASRVAEFAHSLRSREPTH